MISQHIIQSIGWALIHSLWQGLAIYLVVKVIFKAIGKADVRYGAGVVAMVLMLISSVITFFILDRQGSSEGFQLIITRE
ncbi:MAG TPA: hypothetical protein VF473_10695, partial [Cyclobacteriaceae bacterium]